MDFCGATGVMLLMLRHYWILFFSTLYLLSIATRIFFFITTLFSCVLLYLFAEASQEIVQEQITRVLLERLIVNRPHPWGLLITFIELIKNPRYNFWSEYTSLFLG